MGWTVQDVKASSVWEFFSAFYGYIEANTPKQPGKLSSSEADRIWARMQEMDVPTAKTLSTQTYTLDGLRLIEAGLVSFEP